MERSQFTFYDSYFRALSRIRSKSARCDAYDAICRYALSGIEMDLDSMPEAAAIAMEAVLPHLAAGRRKAASGSIGGKAKESASNTEAKSKQTESKNKDKKKNKDKNKNKCKSESDFEIFWDAYPRKAGNKQTAFAAFCKIAVPLETLLEAIEKQKKSAQWVKDGGQFIPHPTTWLNGKRWEDDLPMDTSIPKGATGELGDSELEFIRRTMAEDYSDLPPLEGDYESNA